MNESTQLSIAAKRLLRNVARMFNKEHYRVELSGLHPLYRKSVQWRNFK